MFHMYNVQVNENHSRIFKAITDLVQQKSVLGIGTWHSWDELSGCYCRRTSWDDLFRAPYFLQVIVINSYHFSGEASDGCTGKRRKKLEKSNNRSYKYVALATTALPLLAFAKGYSTYPHAFRHFLATLIFISCHTHFPHQSLYNKSVCLYHPTTAAIEHFTEFSAHQAKKNFKTFVRLNMPNENGVCLIL